MSGAFDWYGCYSTIRFLLSVRKTTPFFVNMLFARLGMSTLIRILTYMYGAGMLVISFHVSLRVKDQMKSTQSKNIVLATILCSNA